MAWTISTGAGGLELDLTAGVHGREWERVLDRICERLASVERVTILLRADAVGTEGDRGMLERLEGLLDARGLVIERRYVD